MTVAELVAKLSVLDGRLEVVCYTEDSTLLGGRPGFLLLDVEAISAVDAQRTRIGGRPYLKLGKASNSERIVVVEVTADF